MCIVVCAQKGSQTCDNVMGAAACHVLRSTGTTVPHGCPSSDVKKKKQINALSVFFYFRLS